MRVIANNFIARSTSVILALVFGSTPAISNTSKKIVPDLTGTWQINRQKSDDFENKMREAIRRLPIDRQRMGRSPGSRRSPGTDGFPGEPPHGDVPTGENSPDQEEVEVVPARMEERMRASDALDIIQSESDVTINASVADQVIRTETFYTNGRKSEQGNFETIAKWRSKKLVVDTKIARGGKLTRTYELQSGGRELWVTLTIESQRMAQPISIRTVYEKTQ